MQVFSLVASERYIQKCMSGLKSISVSILDVNCSSDHVDALNSVGKA